MKNTMKAAMVLGLTSALALGSMTTSQARGRSLVGAGLGFAAGAAVAGAAAASTYPGYYGPTYGAYEPGYESYAYAPDYAAPAYDSYAYSPGAGGHAWGPQSPAYSRSGHGYDTNYTGPNREYQLEGRDY